MSSVASQLIEEVTAHAQSDSLEDAREICAEGTYFPNNLRTYDTNRIISRYLMYYKLYSRINNRIVNDVEEHHFVYKTFSTKYSGDEPGSL